MNITTTAQGSKVVNRVLRYGEVRNVQAEWGQHVNPYVRVHHDSTDYHFSQGRDGVWRFTQVSGWSGASSVYGDACGASGFSVATAAAVRLNAILDAHR